MGPLDAGWADAVVVSPSEHFHGWEYEGPQALGRARLHRRAWLRRGDLPRGLSRPQGGSPYRERRSSQRAQAATHGDHLCDADLSRPPPTLRYLPAVPRSCSTPHRRLGAATRDRRAFRWRLSRSCRLEWTQRLSPLTGQAPARAQPKDVARRLARPAPAAAPRLRERVCAS